MASVKVFGSPTSAEVARVLTCLFETDVDFQLIRVDTYKGRKRLPEYVKCQPEGQALTFQDGLLTLVDSREACRHIIERFGKLPYHKELLGRGTLERASVEQWLQFEARAFDPPASALVFNLALAPLAGVEPDEAVVEQSKKKLNRVLDIYEYRLEKKDYLATDSCTLADLSHLPNAQVLAANEQTRPMFAERSNVRKWWEKISSRHSWQQVLLMQKEQPPLI